MNETQVSYQTLESKSLSQAYDLKYEDIMLEKATMPEVLYGDAIRLKQVLINLVKNALKFTRNGTVKIFTAYDKAKQEIAVHVVDTGRGITEAEMSKLFSLFGKLKRTA